MVTSAEAPVGRVPNPGSLPVPAAARATNDGAVSWAAVFAGAAGGAALALIMLILGVGLGLSSVSPWAQEGLSATTIGFSTIAWLTVTQLFASGTGGYIAGRLRSRWVDVRRDEVRFRDTAHGFLSWAVASLLTAALLTSVIGNIIGTGVQTGAALAGNAAGGVSSLMSNVADKVSDSPAVRSMLPANGFEKTIGYSIDALFRRDSTAAASGTSPPDSLAGATAQATRIIANALSEGKLPEEDADYLGQLVARQTGLSQAEAKQRVTTIYQRVETGWQEFENTARAAAKDAKTAAAYASLWIFVTLLIGAFVASLSATWGGRQRDL